MKKLGNEKGIGGMKGRGEQSSVSTVPSILDIYKLAHIQFIDVTNEWTQLANRNSLERLATLQKWISK